MTEQGGWKMRRARGEQRVSPAVRAALIKLLTQGSVTSSKEIARRTRVTAERLLLVVRDEGGRARLYADGLLQDQEAANVLFEVLQPRLGGVTRRFTHSNVVAGSKQDPNSRVTVDLVPGLFPARPGAHRSDSSKNRGQKTSSLPRERIVAEFDAASRDELADFAGALQMRLHGYARADSWVLASAVLPGEDPALIQLTRTGRDTPDRYRLRLAWIGAEPEAPDIDARADQAVSFMVIRAEARAVSEDPRTFGDDFHPKM